MVAEKNTLLMSLPGSELIGNYLTTLGNLLSVKDQKILHNYYIELKHTIYLQ